MNRECACCTMVRVWKDLVDDESNADVFGEGFLMLPMLRRENSADTNSELEAASFVSNDSMLDSSMTVSEAPTTIPERLCSVSSPISPLASGFKDAAPKPLDLVSVPRTNTQATASVSLPLRQRMPPSRSSR